MSTLLTSDPVGKPVSFLPQTAMWLKNSRLPERLAVGFSGGVDSTALLLALHDRGHQVVAWHVDHGWHADSAREADELSRKAHIWGIEFYSASIRTALDRNREAAARRARYAQFTLWAQAQGIQALCLAHHRDDQAETVCMRMLQGAGVSGCAGMRSVRELESLRIVRPLLHVSKCELKEMLIRADIGWLEDSSNLDATLMRNHIRHHLFPCIQKNSIDPANLFSRWQMQASRVAALLDAQANTIEVKRGQGEISVLWDEWKNLPCPVRACVLQRMAAALFNEGVVLGRRHIELVEAWLKKDGRGGLDLSRCRLSHQGKGLHLAASAVRLHRQ